jgi:hypothetical protein
MVLGEVIDSTDFCVMTLFLSGGYENNIIFTFLYSVPMETENPNLVGQISAQILIIDHFHVCILEKLD